MTTERSHGKPRLQRTRLRDVSLPARTAAKPSRRRERPFRAALRALMATLRAAGAAGATTTPETTELVRESMRVFRGVLRELDGTRSPSARAHALAFVVAMTAAQRLMIAAIEAGVATDRGLELLDRAQRAQGRAERSWTAAVAAAGMLRGRGPDPGGPPAPAPWLEAVDDAEPDDGKDGGP